MGYDNGFRAHRIPGRPANVNDVVDEIMRGYPRPSEAQIISGLGDWLDARLHNHIARSTLANIKRDPNSGGVRLIVSGNVDECVRKNVLHFQCWEIAQRWESGDLRGGLHPNCHCQVVPANYAGKLPPGLQTWANQNHGRQLADRLKKYGLSVTGFDPNNPVCVDRAEALLRFMDKYPNWAPYLKSVDFVNDTGEEWIAQVFGDKMQFNLDNGFIGNMEDSGQLIDRWFHGRKDLNLADYIVNHEFAHILDNVSGSSSVFVTANNGTKFAVNQATIDYIEAVRKAHIDRAVGLGEDRAAAEARWNSKSVSEVLAMGYDRGWISRYAREEHSEVPGWFPDALAEAFATVATGSNPSLVEQEAWRIIEALVGKGR